jgi:uncharacterized membrane protein YbaN (DUF454 family)
MRIVWQIIGLICVGLGLVGIVLPLLPTTPFILLAALCFARSSQALHDWLLNNHTFGKMIRDWNSHRAISLKGKLAALFAMALSLVMSFVLAVDLVIVALQAVILCGVGLFIMTRKTAPGL